ncbi:MAG: RNA 2',3'-cyclic phosphodiesterase [Planctomycetota bacterium]
MRAFWALPIPCDVQERLAGAAREGAGLRAQQPETIHLTLRFLGEISDPDRIAAAGGEVAGRHDPFALEIAGLGVFPHPRSARVLWAGVGGGAEEATALAGDLEGALEPLGFRRERRPWHAHVTLGRFRRPRGIPPELLGSTDVFGRVRAERIVLYRSTLTPGGAVHEPLLDLSLGRAT